MQNQYQQPQGQPMPQPQPQKKYVGGGTAINTQYGELLKISFNDRDLQLMQSMLNEKGWINLNCNRRQQPSQYGQTHSIVIDEWKPQQQAPQQQYQQQAPAQPQYQQQAPAQPQYQQQAPAQPQYQQQAPQQAPQQGQQPGPAVQQGQPYNDSNVPF